MSFNGINMFKSNLGGGININHARVTIQEHMKFFNHQRGGFGGAVRLGELTLVKRLIFIILYVANRSLEKFRSFHRSIGNREVFPAK